MTKIEVNDYVLNELDEIVSVGPLWDAFAVENNAPNALSKNLIGRRVWDFVSGFETTSYLNAIFFACRMDTESFSLLYRCDAPEVQRLFRMNVRAEAKGWLTVSHELVHTHETLRERTFTAITDHYDVTRCSVCCSFLIGENWIDAFTDPGSRYFAKSYAVCPECRKSALEQLKNSGKLDRPDVVKKFPRKS